MQKSGKTIREFTLGVNSTKRARKNMRVFDYSDNKESEVIKVEVAKKKSRIFVMRHE
jgi:hypothetical protein